jgi:hypothetical protein
VSEPRSRRDHDANSLSAPERADRLNIPVNWRYVQIRQKRRCGSAAQRSLPLPRLPPSSRLFGAIKTKVAANLIVRGVDDLVRAGTLRLHSCKTEAGPLYPHRLPRFQLLTPDSTITATPARKPRPPDEKPQIERFREPARDLNATTTKRRSMRSWGRSSGQRGCESFLTPIHFPSGFGFNRCIGDYALDGPSYSGWVGVNGR